MSALGRLCPDKPNQKCDDDRIRSMPKRRPPKQMETETEAPEALEMTTMAWEETTEEDITGTEDNDEEDYGYNDEQEDDNEEEEEEDHYYEKREWHKGPMQIDVNVNEGDGKDPYCKMMLHMLEEKTKKLMYKLHSIEGIYLKILCKYTTIS